MILYKNSMYSCCTHAMLYLLFFKRYFPTSHNLYVFHFCLPLCPLKLSQEPWELGWTC